MYYLIHLFGPVATGTKESCVAMKDMLIKKGIRHDQLMVVSVAEWKKLMKEKT